MICATAFFHVIVPGDETRLRGWIAFAKPGLGVTENKHGIQKCLFLRPEGKYGNLRLPAEFEKKKFARVLLRVIKLQRAVAPGCVVGHGATRAARVNLMDADVVVCKVNIAPDFHQHGTLCFLDEELLHLLLFALIFVEDVRLGRFS